MFVLGDAGLGHGSVGAALGTRGGLQGGCGGGGRRTRRKARAQGRRRAGTLAGSPGGSVQEEENMMAAVLLVVRTAQGWQPGQERLRRLAVGAKEEATVAAVLQMARKAGRG
jgi:hypothetical protein